MTRNRIHVLLAAFIAVSPLLLYSCSKPGGTPGSSANLTQPDTLSALKPADKLAVTPALILNGRSGKPENLDTYRGRYVLLNLWASWCGPCVRELPALARLQQALPKDKFAVVTLDSERNVTGVSAAKFLAEHGVTGLPPFADGDLKANLALHVYGMPTTLLIDPQGREIARAVGPADWDAPASIAYFKALADKK